MRIENTYLNFTGDLIIEKTDFPFKGYMPGFFKFFHILEIIRSILQYIVEDFYSKLSRDLTPYKVFWGACEWISCIILNFESGFEGCETQN